MLWITLTIIFLLIAAATWTVRLGDQKVADYRGETTKFGLGRSGFPVISAGSLALWGMLTLLMSMNTIDAGNIGLVKTFKEYTGQQGPGIHFKAPYQAVDEVNGKVQRKVVKMTGGKSGSAVSKDTQPVYAELTVNYRVDLKGARNLYTDVGPDYYNSIIEPRVQQAFKAITVKYTTEEIAPNREEIRKQAREILSSQLDEYGITINDLLIKDLGFSAEFLAAIERKQVATQDAKAAQEKVAQKKAEADQAIAEAEGKAKATRIEGQAIALNPQIIQLRAIEALNPNVQVLMVPTGSNMILPPELMRGAK